MNHFIDSEKEICILGTLMNNISEDSKNYIFNFLNADDFAIEEHRKTFSIEKALFTKGEAIDLLSVKDEFARQDEKIDYAFLSTLSANFSANYERICDSLRELRNQREIYDITELVKDKLGNLATNSKDIIQKFELGLSKIQTSESSKILTIAEVAEEYEKHMKEAKEFITTGYSKLNEVLGGGFYNGCYYLIGARTSIGKTAFALNLMMNQVMREIAVGFFSLEMTNKQILERCSGLLSSDESLTRKMRKREFYKDDELTDTGREVQNTIEKLKSLKDLFYIVEGVQSVEDIAQKAKLMIKKGVKIIYIDYIGLIQSSVDSNSTMYERVGGISKRLFSLSRELNIPIVCLAQLKPEKEKGEPNISDLAESSQIGNDLDCCLLLYAESRESNKPRTLKIAKNRNGSGADTKIIYNFNGNLQRFTEEA